MKTQRKNRRKNLDKVLSRELEVFLNNTPILTKEDIQELVDANRQLANDLDFIAECMKDNKRKKYEKGK